VGHPAEETEESRKLTVDSWQSAVVSLQSEVDSHDYILFTHYSHKSDLMQTGFVSKELGFTAYSD